MRAQFSRDGHFDATSLEALRALHARRPTDTEVRGLLEAALFQRDDWDALASVMLATPDAERDAQRTSQLVLILVRAQRLDEAAEVVAQQLATAPDHPQLRWMQAYTAFLLGQMDEAATLLDTHEETLVTAGIADALLLQGTVALQRGDAAGARAALERFVAARPAHPAGHSALGRALAMLGDEVAAREALDRARALHATSSERETLQLRLSAQATALNEAFAQQEYARAEALIAEMLPVADAALAAGLHRMTARLHQEQGRPAQADEALQRAMQLEVELGAAQR